MPELVDYIQNLPEDDGLRHSLSFIFGRLRVHNDQHQGDPNPPPFFLGINGVQGAGKTVLVVLSSLFSVLGFRENLSSFLA